MPIAELDPLCGDLARHLQRIYRRMSNKVDTLILIMRVYDETRASGYMSYTNRVTNKADARRMLGSWAELLRDMLDEFHGK